MYWLVPKLKTYVFYTSCQKYSHLGPTKRLKCLGGRKLKIQYLLCKFVKSLHLFVLQKTIIFGGVQFEDLKHSLGIWSKTFNLGPYKKMGVVTKLKIPVDAYLVVYSHLGPTRNMTYFFGWFNSWRCVFPAHVVMYSYLGTTLSFFGGTQRWKLKMFFANLVNSIRIWVPQENIILP